MKNVLDFFNNLVGEVVIPRIWEVGLWAERGLTVEKLYLLLDVHLIYFYS